MTVEKVDLKKILAYTLTAVLLGSVIMLSPLQILYVSRGEGGLVTLSPPYFRSIDQLTSWGASEAEKVATHPTDPFVGALALSFFVALAAYLLFRRRRPDVSYRHSQYFLRS